MSDPFDTDLDRMAANHQALSPVDFLGHSAAIFPERTAVIHGELRLSYADFNRRSRALASALSRRGIGVNDTVSIIAPNIPAHLEAHYGVPLSGAVLNSINIRLDAATIGYILDHGECDVLLVDAQFAEVAKEALALSSRAPRISTSSSRVTYRLMSRSCSASAKIG